VVAVAVVVAVVGVMVVATVIKPVFLLHHYWSRPDTAGSVFPVMVIRDARLKRARAQVAWRWPNNPVALVT